MDESSISSKRYTYVHDSKWASGAMDVHHIIVRKSKAKLLFVCVLAILLLSNLSYIFLIKEKSIGFILWNVFLSAILINLVVWKPVVKESVLVMPAFGVQLETHFMSGRIVRRFIPIGKILKPVLLERVTPITCYWSLSLILREEPELVLVFEKLRPPVKMLVPVWKALCHAFDNTESSDTCRKDGQWC